MFLLVIFVCFFGRIEDTINCFPNFLTFKYVRTTFEAKFYSHYIKIYIQFGYKNPSILTPCNSVDVATEWLGFLKWKPEFRLENLNAEYDVEKQNSKVPNIWGVPNKSVAGNFFILIDKTGGDWINKKSQIRTGRREKHLKKTKISSCHMGACMVYAIRWKCLKFFILCFAIETLAITDQLASQPQSVKLWAYEGKELGKNAIAIFNAWKLYSHFIHHWGHAMYYVYFVLLSFTFFTI